MANITEIYSIYLKIIPPNTQKLFFYLILIISIVAVTANVFALKSILHKNIKYLQKVSIGSLALADIFSVVIFALNNLDALSRDMKTWVLGEFLCYFIPVGQAMGTTMSSFSLFLIALDRYQNLNSIVEKKWDPGLYKSQFVVLILWIVSTGVSIPMIKMYYFYPILIHFNDSETISKESAVCLSTTKDKLQLYYTIICCVIFFPLVVIFSWFYYKIAIIIWKHRIPQMSITAEATSKETSCYTTEVEPTTTRPVKFKDMKLERKLRTFKIIIVLLFTFVFCRLPYWVFFLVRLSADMSSDAAWNLHYTFICLNLLNCALNPFLYTFLNQSITALEALKQLFCKLISFCCCFTNSDFDQFNNGGTTSKFGPPSKK